MERRRRQRHRPTLANGGLPHPAFDIRDHRDVPGAELLGERQMKFLDAWSRERRDGVTMKAVLSQTNFAAVHTIPASAMIDEIIPRLPLPEPGEYVQGDKAAVDLDTNGWPQNERDAALGILTRASAFHIAGDQHLATLVRHGVDPFDDATYTITERLAKRRLPTRPSIAAGFSTASETASPSTPPPTRDTPDSSRPSSAIASPVTAS